MIDKIQERILERMQDTLTNEQLQHLKNVMAIEFYGVEVQEEHTELVTSERHWEKVLRTFLASKRIENCAEGTLSRYRECVTKLVLSLNKRLQDITTNDIRYYLAMYQETREISMSYLDTIRRYLNAFFAWANDEGYIRRNPMRRLKRIKVPQKIKKPFLYSTAARIGEVIRVNRKDIDWNRNEVVIYGEKGKKERKVYLTEECAYHLKKYLRSRSDANPALFVSHKKPYARLSKMAIQAMLRELGHKTDIHAHPHKFRRTLLTDAGNRGIPLQEIQMYAGHQKPDTTMMYVTVSEENVKASFRRYIA